MKKEVLKARSKVYFSNLEGLRTIAFLFVYLQHAFLPALILLNIKNDFLNRLIRTFANGGNGVSIFFVLSGYLITYLILYEINCNGKLNIGYFYMRRILRIWPLYYSIIVFVFVVYPYLKHLAGIHSGLPERPVYYFAFIGNFDVIRVEKLFRGSDSMSGNVTWSLAVEEQFYILWPLLFYILNKKDIKWVFIGIILISAVFRIFNLHDNTIQYFHSLSVCSDLAVGGLFAYYSFYSDKFIEKVSKMPKRTIVFVYTLGVIWFLYGDKIMNEFVATIFGRIINALFFAFILVEQNYSYKSFYKFSRFKTLSKWGKYTYGLYLIHPISILILNITLRMLHIHYKSSVFQLLSFAFAALFLTGLLSYISYNCFEIRFLQLKDKFTTTPQTNKRKLSRILNPDSVLIEN